MSQRFESFQAAFPEERCLTMLMAARHGATIRPCAACGRSGAFAPRPRLRGLACEACNYLVYPAVGTPLENRRASLSSWFYAIALACAGRKGAMAATLQRETGVTEALAKRMAEEAAELVAEARAGRCDWLATIREAVAGPAPVSVPKEDLPQPRPEAPVASSPAAAAAGPGAMRPVLAVAAAILSAVALAGFAIASRQPQPETLEIAEPDLPDLRTAPARPSLVLSSVESDLEAARQATQFALKANPALADIRPQGPNTAAVPPQALPQPPTNILLVPPRLPAQGAPRPQAPAPVAGSGDPEQILTFGPIRIRRHLVDTIVRAGRIVGADPTLLMAVADKESSFATAVQAKTSSATGLFQFIEQTWLGVVDEFGARHGLAAEAQTINRAGRQFVVADATERQRILDLRREPYLSALLAAEMLKRDTLRLEKQMGRHLTGGEVYLIHFLGPDAAQSFMATMEQTPTAKAAELLPRPAEANRPIFYAEAGGETKTLTVAEVHAKFNAMIKLRLDRYGSVRRLAGQSAAKK
jgi:hypothetical protein